MVKPNEVVFWKGPNGMHRRWADVIDTYGDMVSIRLRHDTFDYGDGGLSFSEGTVLSVPRHEIVYNNDFYRSREKVKEHMETVRKNARPIAAGEIW